MSGDEHILVVRDGEAYAADDAALTLDDPPPVEPGEAETILPRTAHDAQPPRPAEPVAGEVVAWQPPLDPTHMSLGDISKVGKVFAASGMFKDSKDAAQAIVKIMAGQELGIGPFQAMAQFHVVEGKPTMSSGLISALVKRSGKYDFRIAGATSDACVLIWYENGEEVGQSSFSMEDAKRAKLVRAGSSWEKFPSDMLFARAVSQGARRFAADVFGGAIYSDGEIGA